MATYTVTSTPVTLDTSGASQVAVVNTGAAVAYVNTVRLLPGQRVAFDTQQPLVAVTDAGTSTTVETSEVAPAKANTSVPSNRVQGINAAMAGVLATLRRGHRSTTISVIGDSTGDGYNAGQVSQPVDEWPQVLLKRLGRDYPAYTVQERRWNDGAQGYDPPTTYRTATGGERRAVFTRATPGSLQYTGTAVTGDIDVRARIAPTVWAQSGGGTIAGKWEGGTAQRSWVFLLNADGTLGFQWTTDGVTNPGAKNSTAATTTVAGVTNAQPYWVRAALDVDNGATGNTVTFYTSPDGVTWTQLGAAVTTAGVTSIFGGTAPYQLGSFTAGLSTPFEGAVYEISVRPGLATRQSVVAALPDDWDWYSGQATVAFAGAPVLTLLNGSASGQGVAYFDNAARRAIINQPFGQSVVMISTSHNDVTQSRQQWITNYAAMVNNIKALVPGVPILALGQNPTAVGAVVTVPQGIELRAARGAILQQWAASQAGVYGFDAWPLLTAADTIDGLHPTNGAGSGSEKWGLGLYGAIVQ